MENARGSLSLDSLYADYIADREGASVYWVAEGFIVYAVHDDQCLIREMFVRPEFRGKGHGRELFQFVLEYARSAGCRTISGMVDLASQHASDTMKKMLAVGFVPVRAQSNAVILVKEI